MKHNKSLLLLLLVVAGLNNAHGQAQVALGIKGGLNFANVNSTSFSAAFNNRTGYHAGAFVLFKLAKVGIQPEIIFSQQGSTVKINTQDFDSNYSYVNIPVIFKMYLVGGLNLQAGPQFGFLTKAQGPVYDALGNASLGDVKKSLKGSDISIGMGAGWDLPFGLSIDARYNLGVSDINSTTINPTIKNQVFQLSAGFKLIKFGK